MKSVEILNSREQHHGNLKQVTLIRFGCFVFPNLRDYYHC